jgi:hypothetical protein
MSYPRRIDDDKLRELRAIGMPNVEIAKVFGCMPTAVSNRALKLGLPRYARGKQGKLKPEKKRKEPRGPNFNTSAIIRDCIVEWLTTQTTESKVIARRADRKYEVSAIWHAKRLEKDGRIWVESRPVGNVTHTIAHRV